MAYGDKVQRIKRNQRIFSAHTEPIHHQANPVNPTNQGSDDGCINE
jgi:hypothetical protein